MIFDRIDSQKTYRGISRNLDAAFDYLAGGAIARLPDGRLAVDGDNVFVIVSSYETKDRTAAKYEAHGKYMDIQIVLDGKETCFWAPAAGLTAAVPWDDEKDLGFFKDPGLGEVALPLAPGFFAVFFPGDAHKPSCHFQEKHKVRKAVVKVKI
jgi:biofilm protein TabA